MREFGFWDAWTANLGWQGERKLLNNIVEQTETEITNIDVRLRAMAREIVLLRTVVEVMVGTLREHNLVTDLDARVKTAMEEVLQPSDGKYACVKCKRKVEPAKTLMTENGPMCDPCSRLP